MDKVENLINEMALTLKNTMREKAIDDPIMLGIRTGGVWVAECLHQLMNIKEPLGILDINFYRDDFSRIGLSPQVKPSEINSDITDRHIILVDDVLHTGRTICAALNEISDYGRASSVTLAVLINRQGRELPIQADVCASNVDLTEGHHIKLRGPHPLRLEIIN